MARKDKSNDLHGQRESLGAVYTLTEEEKHSARLTVAELSERWRIKNKRTKRRGQANRGLVLLALGLVDAEGQPSLTTDVRARAGFSEANTPEGYRKPDQQ